MLSRSLLAGVAALLLLPAPLRAQTTDDDRKSHFGAIVTFAPSSEFHDRFTFMLAEADRVAIKSSDVEIGFIVRGRQLGGDWGVSYIQKKYEDGSTIDNTNEACFPTCFTFGNVDTFQDVAFRGLSVHKFAPFVTIKRRVQIGITAGGGFGKLRGTAQRREYDITNATSPPFQPIQTETVSEVEAKELFAEDLFFWEDYLPIWKVELTGAVLAGPSVKLRVGWGLNYTNYPAFSVSGSFLFGAH